MHRLSGITDATGVDVDQLDITNAANVRDFVRTLKPTLIVNCAAFNDVDGAESNPLAALRTNGDAVWTLAMLARGLGALFVHYTTEFVFDGQLDRPYTEEDEPAPTSVYGMSKLVGERFAIMAGRHYVLRLSSVYGGHARRTAVDWILAQCRAGRKVTAFADRTVSPSYVPDIVEATIELAVGSAPFGTYHCGSCDWCAWTDIATQILARIGKAELLESVRFANATHKAARPRNCAMSSEKLKGVGVATRAWSDALADYLSKQPISC